MRGGVPDFVWIRGGLIGVLFRRAGKIHEDPTCLSLIELRLQAAIVDVVDVLTEMFCVYVLHMHGMPRPAR
jgi:hypothetical protein